MIDIIITTRGPQGCGKTTTLVSIIAALEDAGIVDGKDVIFASEQDVILGSSRETVGFTAKRTESSNRRKIFREITKERVYQTDKWGVTADDTKNTPWMWVSYITQYSTKWLTGIFTTPKPSVDLFRTAMIKVASIAVAAVESLDRQRAANGRAFYEDQE